MVPQTGRTKISPQPQVSPLNNVDPIENPRGEDGAAAASPLLEIVDLRTHFFTGAGVVRAVDGVSWQARVSEVLGVVGESGCGKSVTALSILHLAFTELEQIGAVEADRPADDLPRQVGD
jgi:ABC-type multidrug transport system fused ATPase/permease subunit